MSRSVASRSPHLRLAILALFIWLSPALLWSQAPATKESPAVTSPSAQEPAPTEIERPFLWKIELDSKAPQYLLGTIHVPDERVLRLHPEIDKALAEADVLFVELAPADQASQLEALTLPAGQSTPMELGKTLTERIDARLGALRQGLTHQALPAFRIWAWPLILPNLEAQLSSEKREVLDLKLVTDAVARGIEVRSLEDPRTQLQGFDRLERDEQMRFLETSLDAMEEDQLEEKDSMERLVNLYLKGDAQALEKEFRDEFFDDSLPQPLAERIFAAIMTSRNEAMIETIDKTLQQSPERSHVFAAGAGHFVVSPSIVAGLIERGYRVTRVTDSKENR